MHSWIEDLGQDVLSNVFSYLEPNDIISCAQSCRAWRTTGKAEFLWAAKARQTWPEDTLDLSAYSSFKELVLDGNRRGAVCVVPLEGRASTYKYNRPDYFFDCRLVALQWDRRSDELRLFFDARGESDLRDPSDSVLLVAANPPPGSLLASAHVAAALRPEGCHLIVDQPGHKKGWLTFPGVRHVEALLQEQQQLVAAAQQQQGSSSSSFGIGSNGLGPSPAKLSSAGWGLHFVFGNCLPESPSGRSQHLVWGSQFLDCHPVRVVGVPTGGGGPPAAGALRAALEAGCQWRAPSWVERAFEEEREEQEQTGGGSESAMQRWADLPAEVARRTWGV